MNNLKKRGLGRGLDAILQSPETDITSKDISGNFVAGAIAEIPITNIEANPFQPRDNFEEEQLRELAESIAEQGLIQPVTVRKMGFDRYQLISGERRLRASVMAGLTAVPAYIRIANDRQMLEMALVENIQRQELNPLAIAISFRRLTEECGLTQEELSERVGKKRSTVANYVRLLKLPVALQVAIRDNIISMGHARALINIDDEQTQLAILHQIIKKELSVRQVEKIVQALNQPAHPVEAHPKSTLAEPLANIKLTLSERLHAPVDLKLNTKGKGSIVIAIDNNQELSRIVQLLLHA